MVVKEKANPMLKILRSTNNASVIFTLSGRVEGEHLEELKWIIGREASDHTLVLDLKDVTLADRSAIRFLARCEADDVVIENCPAYIRDWIAAEKHRKRASTRRE